jgi:hypothetical protein
MDHLVAAVLVFEHRTDSKEESQSHTGFRQRYRRQRAVETICSSNPAA